MHLHRLLHSLNISTEHSACPIIYVGYTIHKKVPEFFFFSLTFKILERNGNLPAKRSRIPEFRSQIWSWNYQIRQPTSAKNTINIKIVVFFSRNLWEGTSGAIGNASQTGTWPPQIAVVRIHLCTHGFYVSIIRYLSLFQSQLISIVIVGTAQSVNVFLMLWNILPVSLYMLVILSIRKYRKFFSTCTTFPGTYERQNIKGPPSLASSLSTSISYYHHVFKES